MSEKPVEKMSFEQALKDLEAIVAELENETIDLDQSIHLYERGQALARHCNQLLEKAELKVRQLSGDELVDANT